MKAGNSLIQTMACALAAGFFALSGNQVAQAEDTYVSHIRLKNEGTYTINKLVLKWKRPSDNKHYSRNELNLMKYKKGVKISPSSTGNLEGGSTLRVDLEKVYEQKDNRPVSLPGDHVWLVGHIALGDTKSCRKSSHVIFEPSAKRMQAYRMGGTTLKNNRCKRKELIWIY